MTYKENNFRNTTRSDYKDFAFDDLICAVDQYKKAVDKDNERYEQEKRFLLNKYAPTINDNVAGIYGIKIDEKIVYVGQSVLITDRVISHICTIMDYIKLLMLDDNIEKKYKLLSQAILDGYAIEFIILCECKKQNLNKMELKTKLNDIEKYYITLYNPPLNIQHTQRHTIPDTLKDMLVESATYIDSVRKEIRIKHRAGTSEQKECTRDIISMTGKKLNEIEDIEVLNTLLAVFNEES